MSQVALGNTREPEETLEVSRTPQCTKETRVNLGHLCTLTLGICQQLDFLPTLYKA